MRIVEEQGTKSLGDEVSNVNLETKWLIHLCKHRVVTFQLLKLLSCSVYWLNSFEVISHPVQRRTELMHGVTVFCISIHCLSQRSKG